MKRAARFLLPALLGLAVVAQVQRSLDLMRAQHLLWGVDRRTVAMLRSSSFDKLKLRGNIEALSEARRLDPAEVAIPTLIGSQHLILGELEAARKAYFEANALESRPEILLNLGKVCYSLGWRKRSIEFFARAVPLDPRLQQEIPPDIQAAVSDALRSQDDPYGPDED